MKKLLSAVAMTAIAGSLYAASTDSLEISMTPVVTYSVAVSTPANGLVFGNVNLNTTYVSPTTATIINNGNVSADWKIKAAALNTWQLGAAPGLDTVRILAVLKSAIAASGEFDTSNDLLTVSEKNMDNTQFTVDQTGNNVPASGVRLLTTRIDTPTDTSVDTEQKFRIDITAYPSSTF
jgi:hypothetical protein